MKEGQTHYQVPVEMTDTEIEALEEAIKLMRNDNFYNLMKIEVDALQGLLDRINKKEL